jgi:hypothetical protein
LGRWEGVEDGWGGWLWWHCGSGGCVM